MRLAILALASTLPSASSAVPAPSPPGPTYRLAQAAMPSRICDDAMKVRPVRSPEAAKPRSLGDLPSGDLTLAVVNRVGDCIEPVVVRQGFGPGRR
jgi:hypothetical protein